MARKWKSLVFFLPRNNKIVRAYWPIGREICERFFLWPALMSELNGLHQTARAPARHISHHWTE